MKLYLDGEWNGHGGQLISLALAAEDGRHWYGLWPLPPEQEINPWVCEHVVPHLHAMPPTIEMSRIELFPGHARLVLGASLHEFLSVREGAIIYADWPADIAHLMHAMTGPSFDQAWMVDIGIQLVRTPDGWPRPAIPHNALSDAIALMEWHKLQEECA